MALQVGSWTAPGQKADASLSALGKLLHAFSAVCLERSAPPAARRKAAPVAAPAPPRAAAPARLLELADLADGPYFAIAAALGPQDLARADAVCRSTRELNRGAGGPWWALGRRAFQGLEVDGGALFDPAEESDRRRMRSRPISRWAWKSRYLRFAAGVKHFRAPFRGLEITSVPEADDITYFQCRLRTDLLEHLDTGVYIEVEVMANPDNVSFAVVDFEAGGCSSVTFSPDTGAVIRERKVQEAPRKVEGMYVQPLPTIATGQGFEGSMGLYLQGGRLAFFRRQKATSADNSAPTKGWETTGFVTDLLWAEGRRLTPCLAFRDPGGYNLRVTRLTAEPPIEMNPGSMAAESAWRGLDWDAGEHETLGI